MLRHEQNHVSFDRNLRNMYVHIKNHTAFGIILLTGLGLFLIQVITCTSISS